MIVDTCKSLLFTATRHQLKRTALAEKAFLGHLLLTMFGSKPPRVFLLLMLLLAGMLASPLPRFYSFVTPRFGTTHAAQNQGGTTSRSSSTRLPFYPNHQQNGMDKPLAPSMKQQRREEEPLYNHDDWVRHRSNRADESETIATALFASFVLFLWVAFFQM